jgi:hypothetical protein
MEDYNKLMLINKSARENLMAAANEARLAKMAQPGPSHRLRTVIAAIAIILGMLLVLAVAL